jgi:hypothetical protein
MDEEYGLSNASGGVGAFGSSAGGIGERTYDYNMYMNLISGFNFE